MKKIIFLLISILSFVANQLFSQKKIDAYFDHLFNNKKMMGSVAISYKDSIIYSKSIGFANAETKRMNNENTKFRVGSITKTYTSVLILKAIEEQKLQLETKLSSYYPRIENAEKISIEHLLKNRSGLYNFTNKDGLADWQKDYHTENDFINYILREKNSFEPGTEYEYSNTNYVLLGFILEKIYNKSFSEILQEKIAIPLHLKNTYFSFETDETKNEALSYNIQDFYLRNEKVNFSNHPASGGIASTPKELNQFISALFTGKLISAKSLEIMLPKKGGDYGLGIMRLNFDDIEGYNHSGRVENYISDYWYFPKQKLGLVCLANAVNIDTNEVMKTLLHAAYHKSPVLPDFNIIEGFPESEFRKMMGTYTTDQKEDKITISSDGKNLIFQASQAGQDYVPFEYKGESTFEYDNIKLVFVTGTQEIYFEQDQSKKVYTKNKESV
ncbi:serine hydrolase domain-containing protein [Chryseobacterium sp. MYb264]|uniref:serine hydrolase domain-containing protein n=1 Tax=Chryseobacterium sp. MYb264 TaxID=2745153 RepID=UPI002E11867F|nr:serine hydrolase domain-containing protein [Chryseobacterium sp. MYb264]